MNFIYINKFLKELNAANIRFVDDPKELLKPSNNGASTPAE